jgi:hypothetical protein
MEREKEREELLLLKREVARLTHDLHTLTKEKMEGKKLGKEKATEKRSRQKDEEYVKLPLDAPLRLAGRWLWKSGARRMVTRRGGWVLWEVRFGGKEERRTGTLRKLVLDEKLMKGWDGLIIHGSTAHVGANLCLKMPN